MGSLIRLDGRELFDGELGVRESSRSKVALFELGKSLRIKLGLELFQNVREFCRVGNDRTEVSSAVENTKPKQIARIFFHDGKKWMVRTEDQEVRRSVLSLPRGCGHKERGGESDDRSSETHCVYR